MQSCVLACMLFRSWMASNSNSTLVCHATCVTLSCCMRDSCSYLSLLVSSIKNCASIKFVETTQRRENHLLSLWYVYVQSAHAQNTRTFWHVKGFLSVSMFVAQSRNWEHRKLYSQRLIHVFNGTQISRGKYNIIHGNNPESHQYYTSDWIGFSI